VRFILFVNGKAIYLYIWGKTGRFRSGEYRQHVHILHILFELRLYPGQEKTFCSSGSLGKVPSAQISGAA
jgi:hypothetical protein